MPSQFRPSLTLLVFIFIFIVSLLLVFAPDMHQQPSMRHQRRRFVAPRQVESSTNIMRKAGSPRNSTPQFDTSMSSPSISPIPSSSTNISLSSSSSVSSGVPSSSQPSSSSSAFSSSISQSLGSSVSSSTSISRSSTSSSKTSIRSSSTPTPTRSRSLVPSSSNPIPTTTFVPTPATTLTILAPSSTASALQTSPSTTSGALSASTRGFWANKGAVAGTFSVVSIACVGVVIALFLFMRRRSKHLRDRSDDDQYENFAAEPKMVHSASGSFVTPSAGGPTASPNPSIIELATHTPMDPHAGSQTYLPSDYGSSYAPRSLAPVRERGSDPSHSTTAPPAFSRPVVDRGSYQPSIDSFYGGR